MISKVTPNFWKALSRLSYADQQAALRAYRLFSTDPSHRSLHFKKLAGYEDYWSARVTLSIRAVGLRDGDTIYWNWLGHHGDFDNAFG